MRSTTQNPHEQLMSLLIQAQDRMEKEIEGVLKSSKSSIKSHHWRILKFLGTNTGVSMKELQTETTINDSTLTKAVDLLVTKGLAFRKNSETDRRKVLVFIAKKGQVLVDKLDTQITERQENLLPNITRKEFEGMTNILSQIAK